MSQQEAFGIASDLVDKKMQGGQVFIHDVVPLAVGYLQLFSTIKRVLELRSSDDNHLLVFNNQVREILEKALM